MYQTKLANDLPTSGLPTSGLPTSGLPIPAGPCPSRPNSFQDCTNLTAVCGDGSVCTVSLQPDSVRVNRPVGGSVCGINVKADDFDGVAVVFEDGALTVRLLHRDEWLSIDLVKDAGLGDALDLRDEIARQFRLPAVSIDADGRVQSDMNKYGAVLAAAPAPRRCSPVNRVRPRFLTRRSVGSQAVRANMASREIIARN